MEKKYLGVSEAIMTGQVDDGVEEVKMLLASGVTPEELLRLCIEPTLDLLGDQFSEMEVFLPELINAAEVVNRIRETLSPHMLIKGAERPRGRVVICTVYGDLHSIGKNMVSMMLQLEGFDVQDLGVDIHPQSVVDQVVRIKPDMVCLSALMLASMLYLKDTVEMLKKHPELRGMPVMVGGGAVDEVSAKEMGADGYAADAALAAR